MQYKFHEKTFRKGHVLYHEGDKFESVYILIAGEVQLYTNAEDFVKIKNKIQKKQENDIGSRTQREVFFDKKENFKKEFSSLIRENMSSHKPPQLITTICPDSLIGDEDLLLGKEKRTYTALISSAKANLYVIDINRFRHSRDTFGFFWNILKKDARKKGESRMKFIDSMVNTRENLNDQEYDDHYRENLQDYNRKIKEIWSEHDKEVPRD